MFLPGECHGQRSLAGYSPWGCNRLRDETTQTMENQGLEAKGIPLRVLSLVLLHLSECPLELWPQPWRFHTRVMPLPLPFRRSPPPSPVAPSPSSLTSFPASLHLVCSTSDWLQSTAVAFQKFLKHVRFVYVMGPFCWCPVSKFLHDWLPSLASQRAPPWPVI